MAQGRYQSQQPRKKRRRRRRRSGGNGLLLILLAILAVLAVLLLTKSCSREDPVDTTLGDTSESNTVDQTDNNTNGPDTTVDNTEKEEPVEPYVVSTASIGATGDLLMHKPVMDAALSGGKYDFRENYKFIKEYYESFDLMVANLETTLGGTAAGPYIGYPNFNCPDDIVDSLLDAGIDMLLTANNHTYDTYEDGMLRTLKVLEDKGMMSLGTRKSTDIDPYIVKELNGIKIGLICYTYNTGSTSDGRVSLNGNASMTKKASSLINTFNYSNPEAFYKELKKHMDAMKDEGAEATVLFIHWGNEYQLKPTSSQTKIAKQLCELGVDVIIGGHPHVVEPFETLTSSTGHKTHCIYSLGNALSNQNRNSLRSTENAIYTEDGMVFGVEFEKWSDGTVKISEISLLPTWVNKEWKNNKNVYNIIPLDTAVQAWDCYEVSNEKRPYESYKRTMGIVGKGLNETLEAMGLPTKPLTYSPS